MVRFKCELYWACVISLPLSRQYNHLSLSGCPVSSLGRFSVEGPGEGELSLWDDWPAFELVSLPEWCGVNLRSPSRYTSRVSRTLPCSTWSPGVLIVSTVVSQTQLRSSAESLCCVRGARLSYILLPSPCAVRSEPDPAMSFGCVPVPFVESQAQLSSSAESLHCVEHECDSVFPTESCGCT